MNLKEAKKLVIMAGIRLVETGLVAGTLGNVSCRVDNKTFVITPSGRNYLTLTPDEIVEVNIGDLSYKGNIKPSTEKGIHADVYKLYPGVNFIIHTHQENASIIGAAGLEFVEIKGGHSFVNGRIQCAKYALPGTKALRRNVMNAINKSNVNAVIMKNHGALCFGKNDDETFNTALDLEKACKEFIINHYLQLSKKESYRVSEMAAYAVSKEYKKEILFTNKDYCSGIRTERGFILYRDGHKIASEYNSADDYLPKEAKIYEYILNSNKDINYIIFNNSPEIQAISHCGIELKPLLDDFAQLSGTCARNVENNPILISRALKKSPIVFIRDMGALCCGKTKDDAEAVSAVTQKAVRALIAAKLFGEIKPIKPLECMLMRYVYLKKYSKMA